MHFNKSFYVILAPIAAPEDFRNISKTSTTITFQWDRLILFQSNRRITWYVITCSSLEDDSIFTVSYYIHILYVRSYVKYV